jgi:hypothetical protein
LNVTENDGNVDGAAVESPISEIFAESGGRSSFELLKSKTRSSFDLAGKARKATKHMIEDTIQEVQRHRSRKNSINGFPSPNESEELSIEKEENAPGRGSFDKLKKATTSTFDLASKVKKHAKDKKHSIKLGKEKKSRKPLSDVPENVPENHADVEIPETPTSESSSDRGRFDYLLPSPTAELEGQSLSDAMRLSMPGSFPESPLGTPSIDTPRGSLDRSPHGTAVEGKVDKQEGADEKKYHCRHEKVKRIRRTALHAVAAVGILSGGVKRHGDGKHGGEDEE